MRCENKTFLQNDPGFLQEISSTAVEVGLGVERQSQKMKKCSETAAFEISQEYLTLILGKRQRRSSAIF